MPRNGAGQFNLITNSWYPPVNGVLATPTDWEPFIADVAAGLSQSVSSDGQTPMTGNLQMGNNKITGLAPGTAGSDAVSFNQVNSNAGQCRIAKSGANIVLTPYQGNRLTINGVVYTIPSAGVTLVPTGALATTLYYIYAYMVGAVMTLEYSTTAYVTDTATGMPIKNGDVTRTLVGLALTQLAGAWVDTTSDRLVSSYWNRQTKVARLALAGVATTSSLTSVELSAAFRVSCLYWGDEGMTATLAGQVANNTAGAASILNPFSRQGVFGTNLQLSGGTAVTSAAANAVGPAVINLSDMTTGTGQIMIGVYGAVTAGTLSLAAGSYLTLTFQG